MVIKERVSECVRRGDVDEKNKPKEKERENRNKHIYIYTRLKCVFCAAR